MPATKTQKKALEALNYNLFQPESMPPPPPTTINTRIRQREAVRPLPEIGEVPRTSGKLPTVEELCRMFDLTNWFYFGGKLPKVGIQYSNRMISAGSYTAQKKLIKIGRKYHELFPDEIGDTLKHEMIHINHFHHDAAFKKEAARIGASLRARSHPLLQRPPRYIYICPSCRKEYPRQKRMRMASCGDCSRRGRFDSKYKLVLFKSRAKK